MAKKENRPTLTDVEECREEIMTILLKYNCVIETGDYCSHWLKDLDTRETASSPNPRSR